MGLAANPGTAVEPMCSISVMVPASASRTSVIASAARAGQAGSYGTTSMIRSPLRRHGATGPAPGPRIFQRPSTSFPACCSAVTAARMDGRRSASARQMA